MPMFMCCTPVECRENVRQVLAEAKAGATLLPGLGLGEPDYVLEPSDCWFVSTNEVNLLGAPTDLFGALMFACKDGPWQLIHVARLESSWAINLPGRGTKVQDAPAESTTALAPGQVRLVQADPDQDMTPAESE